MNHQADWHRGYPYEGDGEYIVRLATGNNWYSKDGDLWTDDDGNPVDTEEFNNATITFIDGPRDGETA